MHWVNGKPASSVALSDRSFQYGDGCFTTMLTVDGKVQHWPLHLERMEACLTLLGIASPDWQRVLNWLEQAALKENIAGLKLHISRGEGGRGYNPAGANSPVMTITHFRYPTHYPDWQKNGLELGICQQKLGIMPLLAGHKHNNRLEQIILRGEMEQLGLADGVVCDLHDHVIETTMANLFWVKDGTMCTPALTSCGVAGVMRKCVLTHADSVGIATQVDHYPLSCLNAADEVFMTNAILGIAPVRKIADTKYDIGPLTRSFQEILNS